MQGRNRERRPRGRLEEDRLRSELKAKDKQIGQLKKYIRQLEGQLGLELVVPEEPAENLTEETKPAERCRHCKSVNVIVMNTFKVKTPIRIIICKDCDEKDIIPCP